MDDRMDVLLIIFTGVVLLVCAYTISVAIVGLSADSKCLANGWAGADVSWSFDRYCFRRENQTDIVVPLREAYKVTR